MDYQALQQQLKDLEAQKAQLEQVLQAKRGERKKELVAEFKARLAEEGFDFEEICGKIDGRKGRRASSSRDYPTFVLKDDSGLTYVRGPIPQWMKDKMSALGLDPGSKQDRERFKADYMDRRD